MSQSIRMVAKNIAMPTLLNTMRVEVNCRLHTGAHENSDMLIYAKYLQVEWLPVVQAQGHAVGYFVSCQLLDTKSK